MSGWRTWVAGSFSLAAIGGGAHAQVTLLPDAVFTQNMNVDVTGSNSNRACGSPFFPVTCTGEGSRSMGAFPTDPNQGAQASFSGFSSPTTVVTASASSRGFGVANAFSDVIYSFEWIGPDYPETVPVDISILLKTQATVDATDPYAQAISGASYRLSLAGVDIALFPFECAVGWGVSGPGCASPNFNGTVTFQLMPNTVYDVELHVFAETSDSTMEGLPGPHGQTTPLASAIADPHIFLDPNFSFADQYQLALSAGISNAVPAAVPEPETWVLILIGLGTLGIRGRARRGASCRSAK